LYLISYTIFVQWPPEKKFWFRHCSWWFILLSYLTLDIVGFWWNVILVPLLDLRNILLYFFTFIILCMIYLPLKNCNIWGIEIFFSWNLFLMTTSNSQVKISLVFTLFFLSPEVVICPLQIATTKQWQPIFSPQMVTFLIY
jgi:hypothetical protein